MLSCFRIVLHVQTVNPVHGPQAAQVGHPLPLQVLEVGEVVLPGARVVHLVQEHNVDTGEVVRGITVFLGPVLTESTVLSSCVNHIGPMFTPPRFKIYRRSGVLFVVDGALEEVHHIWCTSVQLLLNPNRTVVVVRFHLCGVCCH